MSNIARRFRVSSWTHTYGEKLDEEGNIASIPIAPTYFTVQLLNLTMDGVEVVEGTLVLVLDTAEALTAENYQAIRATLIERKLLSDGGVLDNSDQVDSIEVVRAERWNTITSIRDGLETKGFPYMDNWLDSDERSAARINTTAQAAMAAAMLGVEFSTDWTTADNAVVSMTRDQVIGMPVAFASYADDLHKKARQLRARINSAKTVPEIHQCYWEGVEDAPPQPAPLEGGEPPPVEAVA